MTDNLNSRLDQVEKDLKEEVPEPSEKTASSKEKSVTKSKKKVKKTKATSAKKANGSADQVHLSDLASEAKIGTQSARKKLREAKVERSGRWSWEKDSKALKDARKALGLA